MQPCVTIALAVAPDDRAIKIQVSALSDSLQMIHNRLQTGQLHPPEVTGATVAPLVPAQEAETKAATPVRGRVLGRLMQGVHKGKNGVMIVVRAVKNQPEARNPIR